MASLLLPDHPLALLDAFVARWPAPLGEHQTPAWLAAGLRLDYADAPLAPADDDVRKHVRALLRHGGFKPSGRSKPASEFLLGAAERGELGSINLAVDLCNVVSLHSGLPISVIDLDLVTPPLRVEVAAAQQSYVFNPSGQSISLDGLLCLCDAAGPCAGPVKDSQRSKTHAGTRASLQLLWGTRALAERVATASRWYRDLHDRLAIPLEPIEMT
jgi:DNA/RNA-binding domain of Phe-tRNA-synthetase-like protein